MSKVKDCFVCGEFYRRAIPEYKDYHKKRHVSCPIVGQVRYSKPWITRLGFGHNDPPIRNLIHKGGKGKGPRKYAFYY
jgi:hypothetical protein